VQKSLKSKGAAMMFIGIDPGKSGALAFLYTDGIVETHLCPTLAGKKSKRLYDVARMVEIITIRKGFTPDAFCVLEQAQPMPGQGVTSMFSIGEGFGLWKGILAALCIPYQIVHPWTWQKVILRDIGGTGKQRAILAAGRLFPKVNLRATEKCRKPHDGIADSLLLAEYARRIYFNIETVVIPQGTI
jgi:crossover junction endodeoxyribonuclease RuvC